MAQIVERLQQSGARLKACGEAFWVDTLGAGTSFVERTKSAGEAFVGQTREAGTAFAEDTKGASGKLADGVALEAAEVKKALEDQRRLLIGQVRLLLSANVVERRVLSRLRESLDTLEERVEHRIEELGEEPALEVEVAPPAAPLADYEKLTAKAVVKKLNQLTEVEARAILAWERAHKKRTTVLKAAEQRLVA